MRTESVLVRRDPSDMLNDVAMDTLIRDRHHGLRADGALVHRRPAGLWRARLGRLLVATGERLAPTDGSLVAPSPLVSRPPEGAPVDLRSDRQAA